MPIHVATFDASERDAYNRGNCEQARDYIEYLIACGAGIGWNICYERANEICPSGYKTLSRTQASTAKNCVYRVRAPRRYPNDSACLVWMRVRSAVCRGALGRKESILRTGSADSQRRLHQSHFMVRQDLSNWCLPWIGRTG
jgi:hypothetical protein